MSDTPETEKLNGRLDYSLVDAYLLMTQHARKLERERDEALEYADKLAQGLPDGMLPKDVEVLREANCGLASELTAVTEESDKYRGLLIRLYNDLFVHHKGEAVRDLKILFREENYN